MVNRVVTIISLSIYFSGDEVVKMSIGKISEFNMHSDNWKLYVERLEQYFKVNKIDSDLYVPTLITVMGAECYELLVNLCTPAKPTSKTFSELTVILEKHLQPKPSILAERFKFRHRKQREGESIAEYVAILKCLSKTCEFGNWLEESLRDQFVCGITSETIRQRLFAEEKLDFGKAYGLAMSLEAAEKNAAIVEAPPSSSSGLSSGASKFAECQAIAGAGRRRAPGGGAEARRVDDDGRGRRRQSGFPQGVRADVRSAVNPLTGSVSAQGNRCSVCGLFHKGGGRDTCKYRQYFCRICGSQGHLRRVCPYLANQHRVEVTEGPSTTAGSDNSEDSDEVISTCINNLSIQQCKPIEVTLNIQGQDLTMECDTGSAVSCISYNLYKRKFSDLKLFNSKLQLRYYTGECISPVGLLKPLVRYGQTKKYLDLYVINNGKTSLLGRQWLIELNVRIPSFVSSVNSIVEEVFNMEKFSSRYCNVFADGLGRFTGGRVSIRLRADAKPVFMRARPLAYALREPVERALEQLVRDGILTPVDRSDWATPIVPVIKKDGTIRICADYKLTLNKLIEVDRYPLPKVDDLLTRVNGGQRFSKIDLSQAYAQFELDESKQYSVIATHKGLYMYNRLVYGLASSPGIFQKKLEALFADLPQVGVFLDDIIITGRNDKEHTSNLHKVFDRLQEYGLRVKKEKCVFFAESINYLGYCISKNGVHTCPDKVKAIVDTPAPSDVSQLRAFIGMVMYYAKFIKNVSTILAPLYNLLRAKNKFVWCERCEAAFREIKRLLVSSEVLVHYSPDLPLVLTADASSTGLGAVISHLTPEGERPIAFASRTLTSAERAYAQIDREALAIIYGVKKFHQFLYGREFILRTDHKALTFIFGHKTGIPVMAASRIQRWAILLAGYNYKIEFVTSAENCADGLSRLPLIKKECRRTEGLTYLNFVENFLPVTNDNIRINTSRDKLLSRVFLYMQSGWPTKCPDDEVRPYYVRRHELYIDRGCIMWGYRVVIPQSLRSEILKQLHISHMGIVKTKSLARSYVWWPRIDNDIEVVCQKCETCAAEAPAPPRASPSPWPSSLEPWSRIHVDFLGPFKGKTFFVVIDASTKWLEIFEMSRTTAHAVIKILRETFARYGLPTQVTSDRGPPFTSNEFMKFLKDNGINQSYSPAYHPSSNGAAENAVKLCKRAIKKAYRDGLDVDAALQTFLLAYRNSVHSSTGDTPAMLLQKRPLRSRLDLLRPNRERETRVLEAQRKQVEYAGGVTRQLAEGEAVWTREYGGNEKWVKGKICRQEGTRRYVVDNGDGKMMQRHVDQIRRRSRLSDVACPMSDKELSSTESEVAVEESVVVPEEGASEIVVGKELQMHKDLPSSASTQLSPPALPSPQPTAVVENRPKRVRNPVVRFRIE
ncbi:uncharacterized protein K02A2.6-like [Bicyclus anynana]|uniref:RNA-directed DNA polymerase n=1 Tax=Bicyclus anynana TaxID=110368 RepID=A0ABM3LP81_BICAN|nr:uncharacterized protein K02A2.6-like [Bicyclus anynana]